MSYANQKPDFAIDHSNDGFITLRFEQFEINISKSNLEINPLKENRITNQYPEFNSNLYKSANYQKYKVYIYKDFNNKKKEKMEKEFPDNKTKSKENSKFKKVYSISGKENSVDNGFSIFQRVI